MRLAQAAGHHGLRQRGRYFTVDAGRFAGDLLWFWRANRFARPGLHLVPAVRLVFLFDVVLAQGRHDGRNAGLAGQD